MIGDPFLRKLFREVPREQSGFPLEERVRCLLAASIERDGSAARVLRFLREYPQFMSALGRQQFPERPSDIRPPRSVSLPNVVAALEYTALSLLPVVDQLSSFEAMRDALLLPEDTKDGSFIEAAQEPLTRIEATLGFSNWLAGQYVGLLPTNSQRQWEVASAVNEDSRYLLTALFIQEKYALSCYSLGASNSSRYLSRKPYHPAIGAFLALVLDPAPSVTPEQVQRGLAISHGLAAVDRWLLLIRGLEGLIVAGELNTLVQLDPRGAVHQLLRDVESVEGFNVARALGIAPVYAVPPPTSLDEILVQYATGASDPSPQPLRNFLEGLSHSEDWFGTMALIDRAALALGGTRTGGTLAAMGAQVGALSELRARRAMKWLELNVHPSVLEVIPAGNLSRVFRVRATPPARRINYITATDAALGGDLDGAIRILTEAADTDRASQEEGALLLDVVLAAGDSDRAVDLAAKLIVADSPIQRRVPFDELDAILPDDQAPDTKRAVMRAIVAEACARHGASASHSKRNDSLDDVLTLNRTRLPSRCVPGLLDSGAPTDHVVYFLERLCTPPIMDTVPVGRSTEELLTERIRVLNALRELVPANAPAYEPELRQVATMIAAKKEMAALDQQRVYVDVEGLQARLSVQLAEDFERFRRFSRVDPRHHETSAFRRTLREYFPDLEIVDLDEMSRSLAMEADGIVAKMITRARDEFASGQDFGLDGYLSGGIRHGNLEAHLREPFVKQGLLGTFKHGGDFKAPDVAAQLAAVADTASIEDCFGTFAKAFQVIVDEVLSEWVRIETAHVENSRAMFDLSVGRVDFRLVENALRDCASVDAAVEHIVRFWLARVDYCLEQARDRIRGELAERLHSAHETLAADLRRALSARAASRVQDMFLDNLVAPVRGAVDGSLVRLCDWFQRPGNMVEGAIDPSIPIEISASLMQQMHPNTVFKWDVHVKMDGWKVARSRVKPWVDITHTLFMNAIKYCGSDSACSVTVRLARDEEGVTRLVVSNQLAPTVNRMEVDAAIARVVSKLSERSPIHAEGGTGLPKIQKWAQVDLRCPEARLVPERKDDSFQVTVTLPSPIQGLVKTEAQ